MAKLQGTVYGAGIYINRSTNVLLDACSIEYNRLTHTGVNQYPAGAGLYATASYLTVTNSLFRWNETYGGVNAYRGSGHGAGLYLDGGRLTFTDCLVVSNTAWHIGNSRSSGAGLFLAGGNHEVYRSRFEYNKGNGFGGGVYMTGANVALLDTVVIRGNSAVSGAGGLYINGGTIRNSLIVENSTSTDSGGAYVSLASSQLQNVTLARNTSAAVGSVAGLNLTDGNVTNCIIYHNTRTVDAASANISAVGGTVGYSCTWPLRAGDSNTDADPSFVDPINGDYRLRPGSLAIDSALALPWMMGHTDVAGVFSRINDGVPDMGAHEAPGADQGDFRANFSADVTAGHDELIVEFTASVGGSDTTGLIYHWDFYNDGTFDEEGTDKGVVSWVFSPGKHDVRLQVENQNSEIVEVIKPAYIFVSPSTLYVSSGGDHSTGTDWASAFTNIQDALDHCLGTNTVLLAGETFNLSGTLIWSGLEAIDIRGGYEASSLSSGPGPWDTMQWPTVIRRGVSANFRVIDTAYLTECSLSRVTVDNGNAPAAGAHIDVQGGGLRLTSCNMTIANCVFSNNRVNTSGNGYAWGGGVHAQDSTLTVLRTLFSGNRTLTQSGWNNQAFGGGLAAEGGSVTIKECRFLYNDADGQGFWGSYGGALYLAGSGPHHVRNSLFAYNCAGHQLTSAQGGAIYANNTVFESITVASNQVWNPIITSAGGVYLNSGYVTNSIVFHNWNNTSNTATDVYAVSLDQFAYSCATELTNTANGNLTVDPLFTDVAGGDFTLSDGSPCWNSGRNQPWMIDGIDLAGNHRLRGGKTDMGAYEIVPPPATVIFIR